MEPTHKILIGLLIVAGTVLGALIGEACAASEEIETRGYGVHGDPYDIKKLRAVKYAAECLIDGKWHVIMDDLDVFAADEIVIRLNRLKGTTCRHRPYGRQSHDIQD